MTQIETTVRTAWYALHRLCESSHDASSWLAAAEAIATKQEKEHRDMGARFTHGQAGYRVSRNVAARCIIIGHVYRGFGGSPETHRAPKSWLEAATIRQDCALAYAIRDLLTDAGKSLECLKEAAAIDYAEDIAA